MRFTPRFQLGKSRGLRQISAMKIAGINFDHFHMGDLLRLAFDHPEAEIVGISDEQPKRMAAAVENFDLSGTQVFTDYRACIEQTRPDWVICCPSAATHGDWVERIAEYRLPILVEKPMAANLAEADRMIAAMQQAAQPLAVNWPMRWYPTNVTAERLIREGAIGAVQEVHYYDGNRGPLYHGADKIESEPTPERKAASWFYHKKEGGGALLDYLGYGTTLGTWFHQGAVPTEVMAMVDEPAGLEVDEHSIVLARYPKGLSRYETRWGTFTDPWTHQPQPKCGFVIKGEDGTISSYDYEMTIRVQTRDCPEGKVVPVDTLTAPNRNPVEYFIDCLQHGKPIEGPLDPAVCRIGQQIVDAAVQSAAEKRAVTLPN